MADFIPVSDVAARRDNGDGTFTTTTGGPRWYLNDSAIWTPIVPGSMDNIAGNCEMVPIAKGYRLWRPAGTPPYNPDWLPTDYWIEVTDGSNVTDYSTARTIAIEQAILANAGSTRPAWRWQWNSNLTHSVVGGMHLWKSADGAVQFQKFQPRAWSQADTALTDIRIGTATVDADGYVTVSIDLTGLSYPVVLDPTTTFNPNASDGFIRSDSNSGNWADAYAGENLIVSNTSAAATGIGCSARGAAGNGAIRRAFMPFDISSIAGGSIISAANIQLRVGAIEDKHSSSTDLCKSTQASPTALATSDWALIGAVSFNNTAYSAYTNAAYNTLTINATGITYLTSVLGSWAQLAVRAHADFINTDPGDADEEGLFWGASENANPPILSITYTLPAAGGSKALAESVKGRLILLL